MQTQIFSSDAALTYALSNSKTLTANNTTAAVPLFGVTGTVLFTKLFGIVITTLGSSHITASFRLNDQTAQVAITLATGSILSSFVSGSWLGRTALAATALNIKSNAAGGIIEATTTETMVYSPFIAVKKTAAATNIEYLYTTINTPTTGAIQFFCEYQPMSADGAVSAL